ncbi:hypothetical protein [Sporosarcina sp. G11-34]|uniref:hypothetical protein n=1 Tax=Sporosarcina sp. G11-34 TaxID=2849605 RepID=UPI0022A9D527|nr:hypothetical protein [Sporosarcina sp. G11-34]MCZ2258211.1 hypothetical protein [Sporosarcina sp. G11-34]
MKKLLAALLVVTLLVSPIGNYVFNDHTTAEAKRYKSGKKNFNTNNDSKINNSNIQKKKEDSTPNKSNVAPNKKGGFTSGGLMKGLFIGGLAGLLFGSLFANMGILGSILGFAINALAIIFLVVIIRKIFELLKKRKEKEEINPWRS